MRLSNIIRVQHNAPLSNQRNQEVNDFPFTSFRKTPPFLVTRPNKSRDSSVGIATVYGLDDRVVGVPSPDTVKNFLFFGASRPALGSTQPPIQWVPRALSPGVKRPGHEAEHSPPTSAEVKKTWIYTSTPPYAFMA
jgi:hypothetical protein